ALPRGQRVQVRQRTARARRRSCPSPMSSSALAHYRGAERGARGLEWLSLSYFLCSVALALGLLRSLPFWLFQIARHGKYWRSFPQRMGKVPHALTAISGERLIWIHAVSV